MFFFIDTATSEIYTLSLHDALPISEGAVEHVNGTLVEIRRINQGARGCAVDGETLVHGARRRVVHEDRKSTRLNSSHTVISYAVFCLKKKTKGIEVMLNHIGLNEFG